MKPLISSGQMRAINVALGVRGLADDKAEIVLTYTNGRTDKAEEMYMSEARQLLIFVNSSDEDKNGRMVRKLFAMAHEMGWIDRRPQVLADGNIVEKKDYAHLYEWVKKYGYLKKELRKYSYNELPKLVSQFEFGPYNDYISKL